MNPIDDIETIEEKLKQIRLNLPQQPGVYRFYDHFGNLLYVGKAKNLYNRVNSYFRKNDQHPRRTKEMIVRIRDLQYTVVNSDMEAILLECNLIKENQPKYNIMLRDGKSYPYISIKNEAIPRIVTTRFKEKDGSEYYGPFAISGTMGSILKFISKNFKIRNCNYNLSQSNIDSGKFSACLEFQIGNCGAPCINKMSKEDYDNQIVQIRNLLKGDYEPLLKFLKDLQIKAALDLDFEMAQTYKNRIERITQFRQKNLIITGSTSNLEVITIMQFEDIAVVNHFRLFNGSIIQTHAFDIKIRFNETEQELMEAAITHLAGYDENMYRDILTNVEMEDSELATEFKFFTPQKGDKHKLLGLSMKNCEVLLNEKVLLYKQKVQNPMEKILEQMKKDLYLDRIPMHIECFDNSNIQGYAPVSSCVVFRNGKPAKRDYRTYNVKTVEGIDDFATMKEVVSRRYRRMLEEDQQLPDLVIVDGGKGQLSFAVEALKELGILSKVNLISIAKRLEEIYFPSDGTPLHIDKKSPTLKIIQHIRNEAHDTAINFHRKKRSEKTVHTELTKIKGIGETIGKKLLKTIGSVKKIKNSTLEELKIVVGEAKAKIVYDYFHGNVE